jgi:hypothetical protein
MRLVGGRPRPTVKLRIEAHGSVLNLSSPILKSRVDLRLNRVGATPNRANPTPSRAEATPDGFDLGADQARRIDVDQRNGVDADLLVSRRLVPHRSQRGEIVEDVHPSDHPVGPQHRRVPGHFGVKGGQAFIQPGARDPSGTADVCEFSPLAEPPSPLAEPRAGSSPRVPSRFAYPLGEGSVPTTADAAYASRPASRSQAADGEARTRRRDDAENQAGKGRHSKGPGGEEGEEAASQHGRNESRR